MLLPEKQINLLSFPAISFGKMNLLIIFAFFGAVWSDETFESSISDDYKVYADSGRIEFLGDDLEIYLEDILEVLDIVEKDLCATKMEYFFDGFILDTLSFEKLQKLSPECRILPCNLTKHMIQYTAEHFDVLAASKSMEEFFSKLHNILQPVYTKYFCPCGVELFDWLVDSAKFYDGNVLYSAFDGTTILYIHRFTRYVDSDSLKRFLQKTTKYLCTKTEKGLCIDDIMESLTYTAKNVENTITHHDEFEDLSYSKREELKQQCDNYLDAVDSFLERGNYNFDLEKDMETYAHVLSRVYCRRNCRDEVSNMYPCCLKDALNDKKLYKFAENFGVSLYNLFQIYGDFDFLSFEADNTKYMRDIYEKTTKLPDEYKDLLYRILHPAKYCEKHDKPSCS